MNNKRGGLGAKVLLVLILMIASAFGGAYGYRVLDGKLASRDALKAVENVDVSDYDSAEQSVIQSYIDDAKKNLETAKTRKEVYDIISDFIGDVDKVQTANEKKLEEALKAAEEAKQKYGNNNNSNNFNNFNSDSNGNSDQSSDQSADQSYNNDTNADQSTDSSGNYKSNELNTGTEEEQQKQEGGFLNSLLGGLANGSDDN